MGERPDAVIVIRYTRSGHRGIQAVGLTLWASGWATDGAVEIDGRGDDAESVVGWIISAWQSGSLDPVELDKL